MRPHVGIVVLAHNGRQLTLDCLDSVKASSYELSTTIVVDNASNDGTSPAITEQHPDVTLIRCEVNLGFAGGTNVGIHKALELGCEHILCLNNDTLLEPSTIDAMVRIAEAHPEAGAVAPLVTYAEPPGVIWYAGADYNPHLGYPGRVRHYRDPLSDVNLRPGVTDRFTGAAVLIRASVLREVGGFDEDLFFLYEDVDLSLRIRAAGRTVWFTPEAIVSHRVAMAQGGEYSPASFYYGVRNQLAVAARHAPMSGVAGLRRSAMTVAINLGRLRRVPFSAGLLRAVIAGALAHRRGHMGARR